MGNVPTFVFVIKSTLMNRDAQRCEVVNGVIFGLFLDFSHGDTLCIFECYASLS